VAYDPAQEFELFDSTCLYTPPQGGKIEFRLAEIGQVCEITDPWLPAAGSDIALDLKTSAPGSLNFYFNWGNCCPGAGGEGGENPTQNPPQIETGLPKMRPGFRVAWNDSPLKSKDYTARHQDANVLNANKTTRWVTTTDSAGREIVVSWADLPDCEKAWRLKYARFEANINNAVQSSFAVIMPPKDKQNTIPWDPIYKKDATAEIPWTSPPAKEKSPVIPWGDVKTKVDENLIFPWKDPASQDRHHNTKWGQKFYEEICTRDYEPPGGNLITFDIHTAIEDVDDGALIRFHFDSLSYDRRCTNREPSGFRDAYSYTAPITYPYPRTPIKNLWIIMNSVSLTRVSDNKPLAATDITVTSDLGSWCWGFEATINNLDSYLAICPDGTTNAVVKAEINGRNWLARVERASETVAFGKPAWRVSGRSLSAELASPAAAAASYLESSERTAVQLMEEALDGTGWTLIMESVDWLVTGGSLSVENETPLQLVQRIAASAGAVIQSDRESKTLRVVPRYKGNPWSWESDTPALSIDESVVKSFSPEWVPGVQFNGVYVSGTNQGVLARVIRSGSAGDVLAPMVTDELCTATEVAMERGRNVLAGSGQWQTISIDLPMLPGDDLPGLLIPGSLIEVTQGTRGTWRAQVVSTRIRGVWNNGCLVRQVLGVERYFGN